MGPTESGWSGQTFEELTRPLRDHYTRAAAHVAALEAANVSLQNALREAELRVAALCEERDRLRADVADLTAWSAGLPGRREPTSFSGEPGPPAHTTQLLPPGGGRGGADGSPVTRGDPPAPPGGRGLPGSQCWAAGPPTGNRLPSGGRGHAVAVGPATS